MKLWIIITGMSLLLLAALSACSAPYTPSTPSAVAPDVQLPPNPTVGRETYSDPDGTPLMPSAVAPDVPLPPNPIVGRETYSDPDGTPLMPSAVAPDVPLPPNPKVEWETYSDPDGGFTMDIPDYWTLEPVDKPLDVASLTTWRVRNDRGESRFHVSVITHYNKDGWPSSVTSETVSRHYFRKYLHPPAGSKTPNAFLPPGYSRDLRMRQVSYRTVAPPAPIADGWAYTLESPRSEDMCAGRTTRYYVVRPKWTYIAFVGSCGGENTTYYSDGRTAIFSLTPTP